MTGKPKSQSNVVEGLRRSFGMRENCEVEYRRVSTIAIGDSVTCKKLLAGGSDSLSPKQRYKRSWSVQGIRENNGRAFFIQGLCLIGERVIFEPLIWTIPHSTKFPCPTIKCTYMGFWPFVSAKYYRQLGACQLYSPYRGTPPFWKWPQSLLFCAYTSQ